MLPFRVYDREEKTTWLILNYHPSANEGLYLAAREDDSPEDGELRLIDATKLSKLRMAGLIVDGEE